VNIVNDQVVREKMKAAKLLRKKSKKALKRAAKKEAEARELCSHEVTEDNETYFSGSYLDKAKTTHNIKCVLCGKTVDTVTETHSWYG